MNLLWTVLWRFCTILIMALVNAFSLGISSVYYISRTLSPCPVATRGLSEHLFISDFCGVPSSRCQCPPPLACFPEHLKIQRFCRFICGCFSKTKKKSPCGIFICIGRVLIVFENSLYNPVNCRCGLYTGDHQTGRSINIKITHKLKFPSF